MKNIYIISRSEYFEGEEHENETTLCAHETLDGAIQHFREIVWNEKANYIYEETGSTDTDAESMKAANLDEQMVEEENGTMTYHIWGDGIWHELFIFITEIELLA